MTTGEQRARDFAEVIRARLHSAERSQTWLAEQLGVSRQAVSHWMTTPPGRERVEEIEAVLDIPGQLCAVLGYEVAAVDDLGPRDTFAAVVEADPLLSDRARNALLESYRAFTGE